MSLLTGSLVPSTNLRAKTDIPTIQLLRVLGPQLGSLYQELMSVPEDALDPRRRGIRAQLQEWFEVVSDEDRRHTGGVREL